MNDAVRRLLALRTHIAAGVPLIGVWHQLKRQLWKQNGQVSGIYERATNRFEKKVGGTGYSERAKTSSGIVRDW
jgi:hypothetical protein